MVNSLSGKDWVPKWEAKVVMATVTKAQTLGLKKALIICIAGGKHCDAEMARQPHLVRAIKQEMEDESFRVRVEWLEAEDFFDRYGAEEGEGKGKAPKAKAEAKAEGKAKAKAEAQPAAPPKAKGEGKGKGKAAEAPAKDKAGAKAKAQPEVPPKAKAKAEAKAQPEFCPKVKSKAAAKPICRYFAKGKCNNGEACAYLHVPVEGKDAVGKDAVECLECGRSFKNWEQCEKRHFRCGGCEAMWKCLQCGKAWNIVEDCMKHQKDTGHVGLARMNDPKPPTWLCEMCGKSFSGEMALVQHKRSAGHDKVPACQSCDRVFESLKALSQHQAAKNHTGVEWFNEADLEESEESETEMYQCVCGRVFAGMPALHQHMLATGHSGGSSIPTAAAADLCREVHVCQCGQSFRDVKAMDKHALTTGHYVCSFVGKDVKEAVRELQAQVSHYPVRGPSLFFFDHGVRDM